MNLRSLIWFTLRLPLEHILWLAFFFVGSLVAWGLIRCVPMKSIAPYIGQHLDNRELCVPVTAGQEAKAWRMGRLMESVGKRVPWECQCLSEALCVTWLLNIYRIPSVFYLGAQIDKDDGHSLKAHAWISVGRKTVVGAPVHRGYQVTATFISPQGSR